ncbi:MAG TPA: regulatory protein RecX [Bacteroidia bacterium]|nr:regulatory protein RecX [Bacteroidia bacterium]
MAYVQPDLNKVVKKAFRYCAYQERSQQEVRDKLYSWGLHRRDVEQVIGQLISDGFLKEERFALAFAGGKFRMKKWGRVKIKIALREKKVSEPLIIQALSSIDEREYLKTLRNVIASKTKLTIETNPLKKKHKIAAYVIQRGFEPELVWEILRSTEEE